ncbi:NAD(P)/FAD-dependent oxidoreductase [Halosegnis sp.]|uniref:NAD(P)/FAD-dependent oxidoreductase n=1 Tax=Halosegnis sp. TaxID=2864959 RepID=UPI0035D4F04B
MDVAVVGGGAVGVTVAHDLADTADVTLYEAETLAAGASGRAAGICYDAFSDRRDAALGERALARFRELSGGGGFAFTDCPYVWLARAGDDRVAREIREGAERMREHGRAVTVLELEALAERFPRLPTGNVAVAAIAESAGYADPEAYTQTMGLLARTRGATIAEETPARLTSDGAVETADGRHEADAVVVAAGAHTRDIVAAVGALPVKPYRVQALVTDSVDLAPPMLFDATNGFYLRPHGDGVLVGDGTQPVEQDPDDWDPEADTEFREACIEYQEQALGWSWPETRSWAGLCTATPDGDPLVGELADGVYVATGWQGHGFMRAPAVAERLAAQVLGEDGPISGFEPSRFDGDEAFEIVEGMRVEGR